MERRQGSQPILGNLGTGTPGKPQGLHLTKLGISHAIRSLLDFSQEIKKRHQEIGYKIFRDFVLFRIV